MVATPRVCGGFTVELDIDSDTDSAAGATSCLVVGSCAACDLVSSTSVCVGFAAGLAIGHLCLDNHCVANFPNETLPVATSRATLVLLLLSPLNGR